VREREKEKLKREQGHQFEGHLVHGMQQRRKSPLHMKEHAPEQGPRNPGQLQQWLDSAAQVLQPHSALHAALDVYGPLPLSTWMHCRPWHLKAG